jgi:hypothetical protein
MEQIKVNIPIEINVDEKGSMYCFDYEVPITYKKDTMKSNLMIHFRNLEKLIKRENTKKAIITSGNGTMFFVRFNGEQYGYTIIPTDLKQRETAFSSCEGFKTFQEAIDGVKKHALDCFNGVGRICLIG